MTRDKKMEHRPKIGFELSARGLRQVVIGADTDAEQAAAHRFLERVTPQLRALDAAAIAAGSELEAR